MEPLKSPPITPLSCPSLTASLSQGPPPTPYPPPHPPPSIHPVSPSFAINLPSPALSVCFPLIQDCFDARSPSLGLKLSVGYWSVTCLDLIKRHVYFRSQTKKSREQGFPSFLPPWVHSALLSRNPGYKAWRLPPAGTPAALLMDKVDLPALFGQAGNVQ